MRELISVRSIARQPIAYSTQLISLQEKMLDIQPRNRPTPDSIIQFITEKESYIGTIISKASMDEYLENKSANDIGFMEGLSQMMNTKSTK